MSIRRQQDKGVWTDLVYKAIDTIWRERGTPPTMKEVMDATGISTKSVVKYEYQRLAEQNKIDIVSGKPVPKWVINRIVRN